MRRMLLALLVVTVALVLLVGLKARWSPGGSAPSSARPPASASGTTTASPAAPSPTTSPLPAGRHVVRGDLVRVDYGPVRVEVTVVDGRITAVRALQLPDADPMDVQLSVPAARQLAAAVLDAQSADVDAVSGATYTSDGYLRSLQSALDRLHALA
jgi:uncharacterized protein with FMN-binding domain